MLHSFKLNPVYVNRNCIHKAAYRATAYRVTYLQRHGLDVMLTLDVLFQKQEQGLMVTILTFAKAYLFSYRDLTTFINFWRI